MILSSTWGTAAPLLLALVALAAYALAAWPGRLSERVAAVALPCGVAAHAGLLGLEIFGADLPAAGVRLGFGPVLSLTICLVLAVHTIESRFVPLPSVRRVLAIVGAAAVVVVLLYPGEPRVLGSTWAPLHWLLGVIAYGLFGAAVLHALLLDAAERRMRRHKSANAAAFGVPLLHLERLTFRFVQAGFVVLSMVIVLGIATTTRWRWDHKSALSIVSWLIFAALLAGRHWRGWRGQRATRWLYGGAIVLLLAYVGYRFVLEVLLGRTAT